MQLTGGNDGINTVIPLEFYSKYNNARTNIAIPESKVLKLDGTLKVGLNPAMTGLQTLFNEGKLKVINSVDGAQTSKEYTVCIFKELSTIRSCKGCCKI